MKNFSINYQVRSHRRLIQSFASLLLLALLSAIAAQLATLKPALAQAGPTLLNFDEFAEGVTILHRMGTDFPDRPVVTNAARLGVATISSPNVLRKPCAGEFDPAPLTVVFDDPQSRVKVYVGNPPGVANVQPVTLRAYSDREGRNLVDTATVTIRGTADIRTPLEICRIFEGDIRRAEIEYANQACEVIDDLEYEVIDPFITRYNFDDRAAGAVITGQYAGVSFPDRPQLLTGAALGVVVNSAPNALGKQRGAEFDSRPLTILFDPPQGAVRLRVGNDNPGSLHAVLRAYNTASGGAPVATDETFFNGRAPITTPLEICRWAERDIRRVEVEYVGEFFEVIDDLEFAPSRPATPAPDRQPPIVFIDSPADGSFFFSDPAVTPSIFLRGRVRENVELENVTLIQEQVGGPSRTVDAEMRRNVTGSAPEFTFQKEVVLFPGQNRLRVEATDTAGNRARGAEITVTLAPPIEVFIDAPAMGQVFASPTVTVIGRVRKQVGVLTREQVRIRVRPGSRETTLAPVDEVTGAPPEFGFHATVSLFSGDVPDWPNRITVTATTEDGRMVSAARDVIYSRPDVTVQGIEITQATQLAAAITSGVGLAGVPMVAGRRTMARVYPQATSWRGGGAVRIRSVELFARRGGVELPGSPLRLRLELTVAPGARINDQRADLAQTWNFVLPSEWTRNGYIDLGARINADRGLTECDGCYANNEFIRASVSFQNVREDAAGAPFTIRPVIIRLLNADGTTRQAPNSAAVSSFITVQKVYPLRALNIAPPATMNAPASCNPGAPPMSNCTGDINAALSRMFPAMENERVYGLTDPGAGGRGGGRYANGPSSNQTPVQEFNARALTIPAAFSAHEFGHTFGLCHAERLHGEPAGECADVPWPYPHAGIGEFGIDLFRAGFDLLAPGTPSGTHAHDFMSYGGNDRAGFPVEWISPLTWNRLLDRFRPPTGGLLADAAARVEAEPSAKQLAAAAPGPAWLISGHVNLSDGAVTVLPLYQMELSPDGGDPVRQGAYTLELQDRVGKTLFARPFDPVESFDGPQDRAQFLQIVPVIAGATRLVIKRGAETVFTREASSNAPDVKLLSPLGGEQWDTDAQAITWQASDADGDQLYAAVQYSHDGGKSWRNLAIDLAETKFPVRPEELPGGAQSLIRVIVSDGFNSAAAISAKPLQVARKAPQVYITSLADGAILSPDAITILEGFANDFEDGALDGGLLVWQSDRDGVLGKGRIIEAQKLSPGPHLITFSATDSDGQKSQASIHVSVAAEVELKSDAGQEGSVDNAGRVARQLAVGNGPQGFRWPPTAAPVEAASRAFISFDLTTLPKGARILAARLELSQTALTGDPYLKGKSLLADLVNYGMSLDAKDYNAPVLKWNLGTLADNGLLETKTLDVTEAVRQALDAGLWRAQFRLRLAQETDGDQQIDIAQFASGASAGNSAPPPRLMITYVLTP